MNKKIIFLDVDGTIMNGLNISKHVIQTIKQLKENGHILVISTGRSLSSIHGKLKELDIENMICSAGGTVVINHQIVYQHCIEKEHLREILTYFDNYGLLYNLECNDHNYIIEGTKEKHLSRLTKKREECSSEEEYLKFLNMRKIMNERLFETNEPLSLNVNKIHWYEYDGLYEQNVPITYENIYDKFKDKYNIVPLSMSKRSKGGEINEKGITKKKGMEIILNHFQIDKDNIYAIGDDFNDQDMLAFATHSIAMGHAPQIIKDMCEFVSDDIEHDGFVTAMKHYNLID